MNILVTGAAGFIGSELCLRLLREGYDVTGFDNFNAYYSVQLKRDRLERLKHPKFRFAEGDLADTATMKALFRTPFSHVVNLAAQAGVRYSLENPAAYVQANLVGFGNLLECCRHGNVEHLVFASSSSVYGLNSALPFSAHHSVNHPVSLYAATKKSNELMAHSYSHLYGTPCTGLRFFTVYGPWGRPDMALYLFTSAILEGRPIKVFNNGQLRRDFTYIDDIVEGVARLIFKPATPNPDWHSNAPDPCTSSAPWRIYNIGNNNAVELDKFIAVLENALGREAIKEYMPMQPGDVLATYADVDDLQKLTGFSPSTPIEEGIGKFVAWYQDYYRSDNKSK